MKNKIEFEPYQFFFSSGLLISFLGLGVWIFFQLGRLSFYPQEAHAFLMVMGFLFAYINGFLMTAIPKMAHAESARPFEVGAGVFLFWLQAGLIFLGEIRLNFAVGLIQVLLLMWFVGIRFFKRKINPPKALVFLPFGLIAALAGCLMLSLPPDFISGSLQLLAKGLLYQAFILNLILGLGSRLIPALTRVQGALDVRASVPEKGTKYIWLAVLLNSSFFIEVFASSQLGQLMKFSVIALMAVQNFKILKPRQAQGSLGLGIRASVYCLGIGFLLAGLFPAYGIHFVHLSFIAGFSLLTILISTRVVLAHGGYNLSIELKSRSLIGILWLAIGIGILRAAMVFWGQHRNEILWVLALSWGVLCVVWSFSFLSKLLKLERHV